MDGRGGVEKDATGVRGQKKEEEEEVRATRERAFQGGKGYLDWGRGKEERRRRTS